MNKDRLLTFSKKSNVNKKMQENPMAFVVPIIDVIDDKTMEYYHGNGNYFQVSIDIT